MINSIRATAALFVLLPIVAARADGDGDAARG